MTDVKSLCLIGGLLALLGIASGIVYVLRTRYGGQVDKAVVDTFRRRVRSWWVFFTTLAVAFLVGPIAAVVLFGLLGFWALREFITLIPTRRADHRALFWTFFALVPIQFLLVGFGLVFDTYPLFSVLIPAFAFLIMPARIAIAGDARRYLERVSKIQTGTLICVYALSFAPAILMINLPIANKSEIEPTIDATGRAVAMAPFDDERTAAIAIFQAAQPTGMDGQGTPSGSKEPSSTDDTTGDRSKHAPCRSIGTNDHIRLLFFFILMTQIGDAFRYGFALLPVRHVIAPAINASKTWEGVMGGVVCTALIGAALWWITPFDAWIAASMAAAIALMGFVGDITLSAIKRDRGVSDYGTLVAGHAGLLDRIGSICFAAPVFYHLVLYWVVYFGGTIK